MKQECQPQDERESGMNLLWKLVIYLRDLLLQLIVMGYIKLYKCNIKVCTRKLFVIYNMFSQIKFINFHYIKS
jgi:hypothetical protein